MFFHSGGKQNIQAINLDMEPRRFPSKTSCPNSKKPEEKDKLKKGLLDKKEPALTIWKVPGQSSLQRMKKTRKFIMLASVWGKRVKDVAEKSAAEEIV